MASILSDLRRIPERGIIAGVCAGIADYYQWNLKLVRVVAVLLLFTPLNTVVLIAYCLLWYVLDRESGGDTNDSPRETPYPERSRPRHSAGASREDLKARFERLDERLSHLEECVTSKELELRRELRKLES